MAELLVRHFGPDKLVLYSPEPYTFHGFKRAVLYCLAYCERASAHEFYTTNVEYFLETEYELAKAAFDERANSEKPIYPSSKLRVLGQFLQRAF